MKDIFEDNQKTNESLFNAGIAKLERINHIKMGIVMSKLERDYNRRSELLSSFFTEIYDRLIPDEIKKCEDFETRIKSVISMSNSNQRFNDSLYNVFHLFERYMVTLEYKYGMSLPNKTNDSDSAGG